MKFKTINHKGGGYMIANEEGKLLLLGDFNGVDMGDVFNDNEECKLLAYTKEGKTKVCEMILCGAYDLQNNPLNTVDKWINHYNNLGYHCEVITINPQEEEQTRAEWEMEQSKDLYI